MACLRTCLLALCTLSASAFAQDQGLLENVVVRHRLYSVDGRVEVGASVGFTAVSRLTDHINLNGQVAYNLTETFAVEARGGWALARNTGLAAQVAEGAFANAALTNPDDLRDLWRLRANLIAGVRWAPVYGKISLLAELPVHFQTYLWLGGGGATMDRQSVVYCEEGSAPGPGGACTRFRSDRRTAGLLSAALGFRFFTHQGGSLKFEIRDYSFADAFRVNVDRQAALAGAETGEMAPHPGFTHLVLFDIGYAFIF